MKPKVIRSIKAMSAYSGRMMLEKKRIGFVPTMGALHEGHLSLIRRARRENKVVVVSIFVNPTQFSPQEDFKKYPRNLKEDALLCEKEGVDIIFYPEAGAMYPPDYRTFVNVEKLSDYLCAKARPGHFKGVATVVAKLFNIVRPDIAYFGQKDAQQAVIIKKMAADLNMPVEIKVLPIIRTKAGLALSSRNAYLSPQEQQDALVLAQALNQARILLKSGVTSPHKIMEKIKELIKAKKTARLDYAAIVSPENLEPVRKIKGKCLIALAAWFGRTRLIDNAIISQKS